MGTYQLLILFRAFELWVKVRLKVSHLSNIKGSAQTVEGWGKPVCGRAEVEGPVPFGEGSLGGAAR